MNYSNSPSFSPFFIISKALLMITQLPVTHQCYRKASQFAVTYVSTYAYISGAIDISLTSEVSMMASYSL